MFVYFRTSLVEILGNDQQLLDKGTGTNWKSTS